MEYFGKKNCNVPIQKFVMVSSHLWEKDFIAIKKLNHGHGIKIVQGLMIGLKKMRLYQILLKTYFIN